MFNNSLISVGLGLCKKQLRCFVCEFLPVGSSTVLCCSFIGACLPLLQTQLFASKWLLISFLLCACFAFIFTKHRPYLIIFAALSFGFFWSSHSFESHQERILPSDLEVQDLFLSGVIDGLPSERDGVVSFVLKVDKSDHAAPLKRDLIKLSCYRCPLDFKPGQHWELTVRLKQPHGYASWGAFDYERYLFRHRYVAKGYVRLKGVNNKLADSTISIDQFRYEISKKIKSIDQLSKPGVAMLMALMIGDKSLMSAEQSAVFQATGVSHLMAISGLHIVVMPLAELSICTPLFIYATATYCFNTCIAWCIILFGTSWLCRFYHAGVNLLVVLRCSLGDWFD